ncbi:MAG: LTA synthase family protein [Candidatus Scatovivens sp.]
MGTDLKKVSKFNLKNIFCKIKNAIDIKNIRYNFFNTRYIIILFGIILLLKTIVFYKNTVFYDDKMWLYTVRQSLFFIIIAIFPTLLFKKPKNRFIYIFVLDFLISIILFADELYYGYACNILSVMQSGNLQYKDEIIAAIPSLLKLRQIFYFLDLILFALLIILNKIKFNTKKEIKKTPIFVCLIIIVISCTYYHLIPEALDLVTGFIYNKKNSVRYGTIFGYHVVDCINAVTNKKDVVYDNYENLIKEYNNFKEEQNKLFPNNDSFNGIADGKNVIIIQLESVQNFVVNKQVNGTVITPNLNNFLNENIYVSNMHSSSYTTTADSEHSFITSTYPTENGEAFSKYYSNEYNDIYSNLKKAGYYNVYAHGNYKYFWNRKNVYSKLDIDKTYFLEDFEDTSELIRTYLSDELLYSQMADNIKVLNEENRPFSATLVAASSHKPFDLEGIMDKEKKISINLGEYEGTDLGRYLEAMNYMDYAFGIFIDKLKERGLYEDSVIITFGDHYGMAMYDENLIKFLGEDNVNYNDARMQYEFSNVACGIRIPGVNNIKIDNPTNKIDIKPTLMQILNIEDEFSIGLSIFNKKDYTCINNGKIITDKYLFDGEWKYLFTGELVDKKSLEESEKNKLDWYEESMYKELDMSKSIVVKNLLRGNLK